MFCTWEIGNGVLEKSIFLKRNSTVIQLRYLKFALVHLYWRYGRAFRIVASSIRRYPSVNIFQTSPPTDKSQCRFAFNHVPSKTVKRQPDWWDNECMRAKQNKNSFLRKFRQTNSETTLLSYLESRKHFKSICKGKKLKVKRLNKQKLIKSRKCPKQFRRNNTGNTDKTNNLDKIGLTNWYDYFKQLLGPQTETENVYGYFLADMWQNFDSSELNEIITDNEIRRSVSHLHLNKSPGPDGVCIELY